MFFHICEIAEIDEGLIHHQALSTIQDWNTHYTERRLMPWKKFFYLQIHLASSEKIDENLIRIIGTSHTLGNAKQGTPGYQVTRPSRDEEPTWRKNLTNLDLIFSSSRLGIPRLAEVADLDEVFAALRIPYSPPNNGFPNMNFVAAAND